MEPRESEKVLNPWEGTITRHAHLYQRENQHSEKLSGLPVEDRTSS
jgi:hypothetical protein